MRRCGRGARIGSTSNQALVDLTADSGGKALAAASMGIYYIGICLTEDHAMLLKNAIRTQIYKYFLTQGHRLYNPKLAALHKDGGGGGSGGDPPPVPVDASSSESSESSESSDDDDKKSKKKKEKTSKEKKSKEKKENK